MTGGEKLKKILSDIVETEDDTFRVYKDRKVIGNLIFESLMKKRDGKDANGKKFEGFYLTSRDNVVGLMSQLYGLVGLLSLISRYKVVPTEEEKKKIKEGVSWVIDYIQKNRYDLSPYLDSNVNADFFVDGRSKGNKVSYVGARTWIFSLLISARKAHLNGIIDFSAEMESIKKNIKKSVEFFVKAVIRKEDEPIGYGYANGCEDPSLFFTYSVVEAYSDFDDMVLANGDESAQDDELLEHINQDPQRGENELEMSKQFEEICFKLGDRAWEIFGRSRGNVLKGSFFSDRFDEDFHIITSEEIVNSSRSSVLFNTLYVIFILFYSYKNTRGKSEEENEEIKKSMSLGLQFIQNFYDELAADDKDSIVDRHIIAFDQKHTIERFSRELNDASILASSLLPMLAKANNLMAYYIYKFPQQKMGELFDKMLSAKLDDEWLWENRKYDLLSTERYLEAIADFFDYYEKFEKRYAEKSVSNTDIRKVLKKEVRDELEPRIAREQENKLKKEFDKRTEQQVKEEAKRYPIETRLNERIEERIEKTTMALICDSLNKLSEYNRLSEKDRKENALPEDVQKLYRSLQNYFESNFINSLNTAAALNNVANKDGLMKAGAADFHLTVTEFFNFIAKYNLDKDGSNKLSLGDIIQEYTKNKKEQ